MSCDCSHESLYHLKEKGKKIQKKRNIKSGKIDKKKKKKKFMSKHTITLMEDSFVPRTSLSSLCYDSKILE